MTSSTKALLSGLNNFASQRSGPANSGDLQNRLMKMAQLQSSDKDVIDALTKKLNTMKIDYDTIQQKYQSLLRNYEDVSN